MPGEFTGNDYDALIKRITALEKRCCCKGFGITELSPPVDAPTNGIKWLGNPDTNEQWSWDGASWVPFP